MKLDIAECEKLVVIAKEGDGWLTELSSSSNEHFSQGGRLIPVDEEGAFEVIRTIRRDGFKPVVLCPDWQVEEKLLIQTRNEGERTGFLLRGRDNNQIAYLLSHPSRQVLEGYANKRRLVCPSADYRTALEAWIEKDLLAQQVIDRLQNDEVRLTEFSRVDETADFDHVREENPLRPRFSFVWRLDPRRRLELELDLEHGAYLFQSVDDRPDDHPVRMGRDTLTFYQGDCVLTRDQAQTIIEFFALPNDYFWNDPDRAALLDVVIKKAQQLLDQAGKSIYEQIGKGLFTAKQTLLLPIAMEELAPVQRGARDASKPTAESKTDILSPILVVRSEQGEPLSIDVQWSGSAPESAPKVTIKQDDQSMDVSVDWSTDLTYLEAREFCVNPAYRLSWTWTQESQELLIRVTSDLEEI